MELNSIKLRKRPLIYKGLKEEFMDTIDSGVIILYEVVSGRSLATVRLDKTTDKQLFTEPIRVVSYFTGNFSTSQSN